MLAIPSGSAYVRELFYVLLGRSLVYSLAEPAAA
jgi:hypothetical protein